MQKLLSFHYVVVQLPKREITSLTSRVIEPMLRADLKNSHLERLRGRLVCSEDIWCQKVKRSEIPACYFLEDAFLKIGPQGFGQGCLL